MGANQFGFSMNESFLRGYADYLKQLAAQNPGKAYKVTLSVDLIPDGLGYEMRVPPQITIEEDSDVVTITDLSDTPLPMEQKQPDWQAIEAQAKVDLAAIETDAQAYAFMSKYMSSDLLYSYRKMYRSDRHEMDRSPRQAVENLLSLPPIE